ncbi:DUF2500 domain-containing protein [Paenibacillus sp. FSL R10-2734]|uniref:DUF2500 domain-containing protein n=1 Tax=Paenibacillus sp. FSL R10-2734 TaxID=2954691 RepID=UPI0030D9DFDD
MSEWRGINGFVQQSHYDNFIHEMPLFLKIFTFIIVTFTSLMIIRSVRNSMRNKARPLKKATCTAVTKRIEVSGESGDASTRTRYFVTFEFDEGNSLELHVMDQEYSLIVEGDRGELSYQGARFKGFDRILETE